MELILHRVINGSMSEYIFSFIIGGVVTVAIVFFESSGFPTLSRLAALFPVFTWLSYLFIGRLEGSEAVSRHSLFVLLGTIVAWFLHVYYLLSRTADWLY